MAKKKTTGRKGRKHKSEAQVSEQTTLQPAEIESIVPSQPVSQEVQVVVETPSQPVPQEKKVEALQTTTPIEQQTQDQRPVSDQTSAKQGP